MRKLFVAPRILAFRALLAPASAVVAAPYTPNRTWENTPWYWVDNRGIASIADGDGGVSRTVNAINSLNAWNGAGGGRVVFAFAANLASAGFSHTDRLPMLNFTDPYSECTFAGYAACTFTTFYQQRADGTWRITDADIVTNVSSPNFTFTSEGEDPGLSGCSNEGYIESIMVHEIGHGLGLDHSGVGGATMSSVLGVCDNSFVTTEADDESSLLSLYGSAPCTSCERYHGHLTGFGNNEYEPHDSNYNDGFYFNGSATTHTGYLAGPAGTDFNLYLEFLSGSSWVTVASSASASSAENVSYFGPAGNYRWRVTSNGGSGVYRFYWVK